MILGSVPSNILTLIGIFHLDCCACSEYSRIVHLDRCACSGYSTIFHLDRCASSEYSTIFHLDRCASSEYSGIFPLDRCACSEYFRIFHLEHCACSGARFLAVQADESSLQQVWVDHWWRGADSNISSNSYSNLSMEKTSLMMTTTFRWCRAPRLVVEPLPCGRWPGRSNSGDHEEEEVSSIVVIANVEPACSNDSDSKQFWIEIVIT